MLGFPTAKKVESNGVGNGTAINRPHHHYQKAKGYLEKGGGSEPKCATPNVRFAMAEQDELVGDDEAATPSFVQKAPANVLFFSQGKKQ